MASHAGIALRTYLVPLFSTRAVKITLLLIAAFLGLAVLALLIKPLSEFFSEVALERMRRMIVVPGVPIIAILLAEIPLRDGIRHRTLLYPLLGPVPRTTLAVTRTLATAAVLAVTASFLTVVVTLLQGNASLVARELLAVWLGATTYIGLFGVVHLITKRGLIAGLAIYGLMDDPLGRLPFALRNLSPSYHMRVLADQEVEITLPIELTPPESSMAASSLILIVLTIVFSFVVAFLFTRKRLPELC